MNVVITGATINSPPVVNFRVTNQHGQPVSGLTTANVSFTIAKLIPGSSGDPSKWQNYINLSKTAAAGSPKAGESAVQAQADSTGALVDNADGTYSYTFSKDITNATCPAPCQDASGKPLDLTYDPTLTHRVAFQLRGVTVAGSNPAVALVTNAVYTFRPADGATTGIATRDIVKTATCNGCHNKLAMHGGGRVETKFCVTCHNPGTTDPETGNTVDFKVMIHKIHRGENLPSVAAGTAYEIWGHLNTRFDFSSVVFPQDVRNCSKCHNANDTETPQAVNWSTAPSIEACGSCHDNVNFATGAGHTINNQAVTNAECITCHAAGKIAGSVEASHSKGASTKVATATAALQPSSPWMKSQSAKFKYNIVSVTNTGPGQQPVVKFSVTDPTNANTSYDIKTHPAFASTGAFASMSVAFAWNTPDTAVADADYNNVGSTKNPGQAYSVAVTGAGAANAVANGDNTYTVTSPIAIPSGASGTGRAALQGYLATDADGDGVYKAAGAERLPVKTAIKDFVITGTAATPRRAVVDVGKCKGCHEVLSLHGNNRTDEPGVCVMCHNPNDTDANQRPKLAAPDPQAGTVNVAATPDGKTDESIDFKRMIHGIHAGAKTNYDGTAGHGYRNKGLVVYGHGGSKFDFSHVRFPGKVNDCKTCHLAGTYQLTGKWASPTENGILASTTQAAPNAVDTASFTAGLLDQTDDRNITPTAAVCSSCHDGGPAKTHMISQGALFDATQAQIRNANAESCSICHGPGRDMDVDRVHYKK